MTHSKAMLGFMAIYYYEGLIGKYYGKRAGDIIDMTISHTKMVSRLKKTIINRKTRVAA